MLRRNQTGEKFTKKQTIYLLQSLFAMKG